MHLLASCKTLVLTYKLEARQEHSAHEEHIWWVDMFFFLGFLLSFLMDKLLDTD